MEVEEQETKFRLPLIPHRMLDVAGGMPLLVLCQLTFVGLPSSVALSWRSHLSGSAGSATGTASRLAETRTAEYVKRMLFEDT